MSEFTHHVVPHPLSSTIIDRIRTGSGDFGCDLLTDVAIHFDEFVEAHAFGDGFLAEEGKDGNVRRHRDSIDGLLTAMVFVDGG